MTGWGMPEGVATGVAAFLGIFVLIAILMVIDIFLVWLERKVVARFQDRIGPNRLGPFGLIQPFADIIKLLIKEDITPANADKVVYNLAPMLSMMSVLILWAIIPLAPNILGVGVDLNVAALYIIAGRDRYAVDHHGRLVVEQQVCPAGCLPPGGGDGALRDPDGGLVVDPHHPGKLIGHECHHQGPGYLVLHSSAGRVDLPNRRHRRTRTRSLRHGRG